MELSKRLQAVIRLMPAFGTVCDVGCDHGYVAISLLREKKAAKVIAMDVNAGPLKQARHNGAAYGMTDRMDFRLSDGLKEVCPGEADAFLCAGMGGRLMVRIMTEGWDVMETMQGAVLQPQSEIEVVRRFVYEKGWHILAEDMVFEPDGDLPDEGKYYPMMFIEPGTAEMPEETALLYGPRLLQERHPVLLQYLQFSLRLKESLLQSLRQKAIGEKAMERICGIEKEIAVIKRVLQTYNDV